MQTITRFLAFCLVVCGLIGVPAYAQSTPDPAEESEPSAFQATSQFLITRINQMGLDLKIREMKANHQTEYKDFVGFTADGAIFYNRELLQKYEDATDKEVMKRNHQEMRTQGLQFIPYRIGILSDGSARVSVGLAAFRNQDPRHEYLGVVRRRHSRTWIRNIPKAILAADFLVFEWDDRYSQQNWSSRELKIGSVVLKQDLFANYKRSNVLAFTAGGSIGYAHTNAQLEDGRSLAIGSEKNPAEGFALKTGAQIGLRYTHFNRTRFGRQLEVTADIKNTRLSGYAMDTKAPPYLRKVRQYRIDRDQFDADIAQWLIDHNLPDPHVPLDDVYYRFTGNRAPVPPLVPEQNVVVRSTYFSPSVTYKLPLNMKYFRAHSYRDAPAPRQIMIGVKAGANLPLDTRIEGGSPEESSIHESFSDQLDRFHVSVGLYF